MARLALSLFVAATLVAGLVISSACQAAPRGRVIRTSPIDSGPGTVESERRKLQGTWELAKLETFDAAGKPQVVEATGRMTFDDYGNVKTTGATKEASGTAGTILIYEGRVVIDPVKKEWRILDVEAAPESGAPPKEVSADKIRAYEFQGEELRLSIRDAAGRVTAAVTWRRVGAA